MKTSQKQREDDLQAATPFVTLTRGAEQFETPKSPKPEENLARSNKVNKRFKTLMSIFETKNSPFMNSQPHSRTDFRRNFNHYNLQIIKENIY